MNVTFGLGRGSRHESSTAYRGAVSNTVLDVHVVFADEDQPIARRIIDALRDLGISVWSHLEISTEQSREDALDSVNRLARKVLVIWSPHAIANEALKAQAMFAHKASKLIQAYAEPCTAPVFLAERQGIDLRHIEEAAGSISALLKATNGISTTSVQRRRRRMSWHRRTKYAFICAMGLGGVAYWTVPDEWRFWDPSPKAPIITLSQSTDDLIDVLGRRLSIMSTQYSFIFTVPYTRHSSCGEKGVSFAHELEKLVNNFFDIPGVFMLIDLTEQIDLDGIYNNELRKLGESLGPRFFVISRKTAGDAAITRTLADTRTYVRRVVPSDASVSAISYDHSLIGMVWGNTKKLLTPLRIQGPEDNLVDAASTLLSVVFKENAAVFTQEARTLFAGAENMTSPVGFRHVLEAHAATMKSQFAALDIGRPLRSCG